MPASASPNSDPPPESPAAPQRDALASLRIERPDSHESGRKRRWWRWIVALIVLAGGFFAGIHLLDRDGGLLEKRGSLLPEIMQQRVEVRLQPITVREGRSADAVVVASGYIESRRQARIGARAAGRIDAVFFEEGDPVEEDQLLAELDHADLDAALAAAAAAVDRAKAALAEQEVLIEQAQVEVRRTEKLWRARSAAESDYDQARFAYQAAVAKKKSLESEIALAEAQRLQAERLRENMFIRAPFAGTVISKDAEAGESIMPGGTGGDSGRGSVATIADLENLEIECDVQEDFISRVSAGQEADIAVDAVQDRKYHGRVRKIIPMGDRARATIKVQVEITDADKLLFPEMSGTVYFLPDLQGQSTDDQTRMFCPASAVTSNEAGDALVWVVDAEKRAQPLSVKTGIERDGQTEIVSGLSGSERVIVNPRELYAGAPVRVVE